MSASKRAKRRNRQKREKLFPIIGRGGRRYSLFEVNAIKEWLLEHRRDDVENPEGHFSSTNGSPAPMASVGENPTHFGNPIWWVWELRLEQEFPEYVQEPYPFRWRDWFSDRWYDLTKVFRKKKRGF